LKRRTFRGINPVRIPPLYPEPFDFAQDRLVEGEAEF
jgi:hypothetical protein